jgi:hypothetical protein
LYYLYIIYVNNSIRNSSHDSIFRFSLKTIFSAADGEIIDFVNQSKTKFYAGYENSFMILPDEKTIIGIVCGNNQNVMAMEDITNPGASVSIFGSGGNQIYSILPSKDFKFLFVGDHNGNLHQYNLDKISNKWTHAKNHGNIGLSHITSSTSFENLAIFGGCNSHIRILDMAKKQIFIGPFKTALKYVYSLQACRVSRSKVLLTAVGYDPKYSNSKSDLFDITELLAFHNVKYDLKTPEESDDDYEIKDRDKNHKKSVRNNLNNFEHILELIFEKVHKLVGEMVNDKFQKLEEKILKSRGIRNKIKGNKNQKIVRNTKSEIKKKLVEIIKKYKADFMGKYI